MTINERVYNNAVPTHLKKMGRSDSPMAFDPSIFNTPDGLEGLYNIIQQRSNNRRQGTLLRHVQIAKPLRGETRPIALISIPESVEYFILALHLAYRSKGLTNDVSYSFKPSKDTKKLRLYEEKNNKPSDRWVDYREAEWQNAQEFPFCCSLDIRGYFTRINHAMLVLDTLRHYQDNFVGSQFLLAHIADRTLDLLTGWYPNGLGIPQGHDASSMFADIHLLSLDFLLDRPPYRALRYMDDYRLFTRSIYDAHRQFEFVEAELEKRGLEINTNKVEFAESSTFAYRVEYTRIMRDKYLAAMSKINEYDHQERIRVTLEFIDAEIRDGDIDRYYLHFMLACVRSEIRRSGSIRHQFVEQIYFLFVEHMRLSGVAFQKWRSLFSGLIENASIQEILATLVVDSDNWIDSDRAIASGILSLAPEIHSHDLRDQMNDYFRTVSNRALNGMDASETAYFGKSLRAFQKHGKGNEALMDRRKALHSFPDVRAYLAVAGTDLSDSHKTLFYHELRKTSDSWEDIYALNFFEENGETSPVDRRMPSILSY